MLVSLIVRQDGPAGDDVRGQIGQVLIGCIGMGSHAGQRFRQEAGPAVRITVGDLEEASAGALAATLRAAVRDVTGGVPST